MLFYQGGGLESFYDHYDHYDHYRSAVTRVPARYKITHKTVLLGYTVFYHIAEETVKNSSAVSNNYL